MTLGERFARHVTPEPNTGCFIWVGSLTPLGYGSFRLNGVTCCAHRVAWALERGPVPADLEVDHLCRNRACVNVAHMELVTHAVNMHRGNSRAGLNKRKTHCLRGHPLDGENVRVETQRNGQPRRSCRQCERLRAKGVAPPAPDPAQPWLNP